MQEAGAETDALCVFRARFEELTLELYTLTSGADRAKVDCDTLADHVKELEAATPKCNSQLEVFISAVCALRDHVAAGESRADTGENQARNTSDKRAKLLGLLNGLTQAVAHERMGVANIVHAELSCVRSVFTTALTESEETVSEAIGGFREGFPVDSASSELRVSMNGSSAQAWGVVPLRYALVGFLFFMSA